MRDRGLFGTGSFHDLSELLTKLGIMVFFNLGARLFGRSPSAMWHGSGFRKSPQTGYARFSTGNRLLRSIDVAR